MRFARIELSTHYSSHVQIRVRNTLDQGATDERWVSLVVVGPFDRSFIGIILITVFALYNSCFSMAIDDIRVMPFVA